MKKRQVMLSMDERLYGVLVRLAKERNSTPTATAADAVYTALRIWSQNIEQVLYVTPRTPKGWPHMDAAMVGEKMVLIDAQTSIEIEKGITK